MLTYSRAVQNPHIAEYQVTQTATGADILAVGGGDADALRTSVVAAMRRYGVSDPMVDIRVVDRIPRQGASGKLKRFIAR